MVKCQTLSLDKIRFRPVNETIGNKKSVLHFLPAANLPSHTQAQVCKADYCAVIKGTDIMKKKKPTMYLEKKKSKRLISEGL